VRFDEVDGAVDDLYFFCLEEGSLFVIMSGFFGFVFV